MVQVLDSQMTQCTDKLGELEQFVRLSNESSNLATDQQDDSEKTLRAQYATILVLAARLASIQKNILRYKKEYFVSR